MGQKMTNAPVYFAIAQVRFNPVLSLETFMAGIQESFRKMGFPDFKKLMTMAFNLGPAVGAEAGQAQPPTVQQVERYNFLKMDGRSGFILMQNSLSYQITEYDTFGTFLADFMKGLEIIHKAIGLNYSERVGIRYLDAVLPPADGNVAQFLVPEAIGLSVKLTDVAISHSFTETLFTFPNVGSVLSRVIVQNGPLAFPPDLQPDGLKVVERFQNQSGPHAVIDTDGFFDGREVFAPEQVAGRLHALHDKIDRCFHAMITDHARTAWK